MPGRGWRRLALLPPPTDGGLTTAAFSPDGTLVVTNGTSGNPQVWTWRTQRLRTVQEPGGAVSAEFAPNGRTILAATYESLVLLLRAPGARG